MLRRIRQRPDIAPAVLAGVLGAVLMAVRLLAGTPVGMADNGDGIRLLCQLGATADGPPPGSERFDFVHFIFPALSPEAACAGYPSSQLLQLRLTAWVHDLLGRPGVIDMRLVILQDCLLVGLAIGTAVWLLRGARWWARAVVPAALFLVLADATFAGYAASPFGEPAAFIGLVTVALAGVAVVSGRHRRTAFLIATAGAALAVGAKVGMITLAVPFALFLGSRRLPLGRWRSGVASFVLAAVGVAAVGGAVAWVSGAEPGGFERINVANEITQAIMPASEDPVEVAVDLGLPASFARFSGQGWWSKQPIHSAPEWPSVSKLMTRDHLARYLLDHPGVTARVLAGGADSYLHFRPHNLGSYGVGAGEPPRAQECRLCLLPTVSRAFAWSGFPGVVAYWLACLAAAALLARRSDPGTARRGFALVTVMLIGCTVVQYVTAVLGDGAEVTKHLVVGLLAASLAPVWLLAARLTPGRQPADHTPQESDREPLPAHSDANG
ncbi:glycan biosynthesis hexose transferase WsfD [Actinokineospora sp. 24-640]